MSLVLRGSTVPGLQAMASELAARHFVIREAHGPAAGDSGALVRCSESHRLRSVHVSAIISC